MIFLIKIQIKKNHTFKNPIFTLKARNRDDSSFCWSPEKDYDVRKAWRS